MNTEGLYRLRKQLQEIDDDFRDIYFFKDEALMTKALKVSNELKEFIYYVNDTIDNYKEKDERLTKTVSNIECPNLNCKTSVPFTKEDGRNMVFICPSCGTHNCISLNITRIEFRAFVDAKMDSEVEDSKKSFYKNL